MSRFTKRIADDVFDLQNRGLGTEFWLSTTIISAPGVTPLARDLTLASVNGELLIEDIIIKTDGTGIAGASTLVLLTNSGTRGTTTIMAVGVAELGGSTTIDFDWAKKKEQISIHKDGRNSFDTISRLPANVRNVLKSGEKVQILGTGVAATGSGKFDVYIKFRRLAAGADVKIA